MKTVVVFAELTFINHGGTVCVTEHSVFGKGKTFVTASEFIARCQEMWKKNCEHYKITNVVIEG